MQVNRCLCSISPGPAATKHSWVQNSASTLRKYSNLQSQPQVTATKYLSTYSNKKFEYVLKLFEIPLHLSQVRTQAFIWSFMYSSIFWCWFHNEFIHFLTFFVHSIIYFFNHQLITPNETSCGGYNIFNIRPFLCQSDHQSCFFLGGGWLCVFLFFCQRNFSETVKQNFVKLFSYDGHTV